MTSLPERYAGRRGDVARERARLAGLAGRELSEQKKCVRWAEIDEALEVRLDPAAHELAGALAASGDTRAREALDRAARLDPQLVGEAERLRRSTRDCIEPLQPADPEPFRRLRERLEAARAAGVPFSIAWGEAVAAELPSGEWRIAATGTIAHWRTGYERAGWQGITALREQGGNWAERPVHQLVA